MIQTITDRIIYFYLLIATEEKLRMPYCLALGCVTALEHHALFPKEKDIRRGAVG